MYASTNERQKDAPACCAHVVPSWPHGQERPTLAGDPGGEDEFARPWWIFASAARSSSAVEFRRRSASSSFARSAAESSASASSPAAATPPIGKNLVSSAQHRKNVRARWRALQFSGKLPRDNFASPWTNRTRPFARPFGASERTRSHLCAFRTTWPPRTPPTSVEEATTTRSWACATYPRSRTSTPSSASRPAFVFSSPPTSAVTSLTSDLSWTTATSTTAISPSQVPVARRVRRRPSQQDQDPGRPDSRAGGPPEVELRRVLDEPSARHRFRGGFGPSSGFPRPVSSHAARPIDRRRDRGK